MRLRKPVLQDAEEIFRKYAQDPEVTKYLTWRPKRNDRGDRDFLRGLPSAWDEGKSFHWVIWQKEDNQLLGMITARVDDHKWELGYVLARSYWGKGYMTEARQKTGGLGIKAEGDLPRLVGLRCRQSRLGPGHGERRE